MVKSSPTKISKVEKSTSSISTGESSKEYGSSQGCVDITWEDDESIGIKEEPPDEFVSPGADSPHYIWCQTNKYLTVIPQEITYVLPQLETRKLVVIRRNNTAVPHAITHRVKQAAIITALLNDVSIFQENVDRQTGMTH